jgi:hypothetical protein
MGVKNKTQKEKKLHISFSQSGMNRFLNSPFVTLFIFYSHLHYRNVNKTSHAFKKHNCMGPRRGCSGSIPTNPMWNLWQTKWQWDRFSPNSWKAALLAPLHTLLYIATESNSIVRHTFITQYGNVVCPRMSGIRNCNNVHKISRCTAIGWHKTVVDSGCLSSNIRKSVCVFCEGSWRRVGYVTRSLGVKDCLNKAHDANTGKCVIDTLNGEVRRK